ncbi:MAG: hypothetical protein M1835_007799 [Candelina submexicana]|nr:MAG: hypothetical protein M1835_007799 [Candelina submexicana]
MREVNFSIPTVNKASVGITTALYDRRALDCTSTLPLINSLNHLAYLTTSSARIRDILTVDGGVERLVCILKDGRSKEMMDMWKWNLAFQCVVNIGVRGSENVRTRVVEADVVPVIATILDNYIKVVDKCREKAEAESKKNSLRHGLAAKTTVNAGQQMGTSFYNRSHRGNSISVPRPLRRQAPPSIEIPLPFLHNQQPVEPSAMDTTSTPPPFAVTSPPERTTFLRHHHHRSHDGRHHYHGAQTAATPHHSVQQMATAVPSMDMTDGFGLRPVRDIDRLPSMLPGLQTGITSQPESPTTPNAASQTHTAAARPAATSAGRSRRRPSIRHQQSMSGDSDDANGDDIASDASARPEVAGEPIVDIQSGLDIRGLEERDAMLDAVAAPLGLESTNASETQDAETFNITHRSLDGSIANGAGAPNTTTMGFSPVQRTLNIVNVTPTMPLSTYPRYLLERPTSASILAAMPRDEDVIMSLQLLAYVSKYCNLRSYFQQSHLVPLLKIGNELQMLDDDSKGAQLPAEELEEEYLVPDDFNIFPLVEKFTVRHHTQDMQYWAGVVMRNLCRKDDSRGGTRQCAYYQCGKWEEYQRQFAKCRRCRRTKYCSKECQKSAWGYHRHWCTAAPQ